MVQPTSFRLIQHGPNQLVTSLNNEGASSPRQTNVLRVHALPANQILPPEQQNVLSLTDPLSLEEIPEFIQQNHKSEDPDDRCCGLLIPNGQGGAEILFESEVPLA